MSSRTHRHWQQACRYYTEQNLAAAVSSCEAMLADESEHPLAHWLLATIYLEQNRERAAAEHADRATTHALSLPLEDRLRITWALVNTGQSDSAQRLLRLTNPSDPALRGGLQECARQLAFLDMHEPALACLDALFAEGARNPVLSHLRGSLLGFMGNAEEAAAAFEQSIALAPDFLLAHWSLSQLGFAEGASARIDRLRRIHQRIAASTETDTYIGYTLFKELDEIDDRIGAWNALTLGAAARNSVARHDAHVEDLLFDEVISSAGPPRAAVDASGETPIFIVGMPRTGTTLLERILGNHPDIAICGELTDLVQQVYWSLDRSYAGMLDRRAVAALPGIDASLLGQRYLAQTAWRRTGKNAFTDKNPGNFMLAGVITRAIPQAKILHIRRNPVDACFSNFKVLFAPDAYSYSYSLDNLARHHRNYSRLMQHWEKIAPAQLLTIDYEALTREPEKQAQRIVAFCGLRPQASISDVTTNKQAVTTASKGQVREAIHSRNIDGWKRYRDQLDPLRYALGVEPG
jgi:tetratricopeptide (TPR) repeat protein